jgi:hypothetical protein
VIAQVRQPTRVGVLGASGATGRVAATELAKLPEIELLLGGRDRARLRSATDGRLRRRETRLVDVDDDASLQRFCAECEVVVNCAGPSAAIRDRVARVAVAAGSHYVDPGGDEEVVAELTESWREPAEAGLACVFSAGWIPGLSGILARYVDGLAREQMDEVGAVELYCGDSNVWSDTGFEDALSLFSRYPGPLHYEGGRPVHRRLGRAGTLRRVALPAPVGTRVAVSWFLSELRALARASDGAVRSYVVPLGSPATAAAMGLGVALVERAPRAAARLLRKATALDARRHEALGFLAASAQPADVASPERLTVVVVERRHYWITGLVCALAVETLLGGRLSTPTGCHYLCDAVDPVEFMGELAARGVHMHATGVSEADRSGGERVLALA